ncbi:hypothetical protein BDY17DRAFT_288512 [Neohortaea acidophila]|uniref:Ketoreductase domain-containing protein n=1 Tax=Neohortaea acidophila TaxID=245834 RepID=A0A6A6Q470_9PEZI|nr:uncharacterized protein BDY17DRAFT_288512 [Neohortaea acidophila]KAF2487200.1 hypothetical protein BDY17DRAFT_288512 [Neohortaea acidophila]
MAATTPRTLEGKVAIVTGGSRGIGSAIAFTLASHGAKVAITYTSDRSSEPTKALVERISSEAKSRAISIQCDLKDPKSPQKIVDETVKEFGHIDILVNNAAVFSTTFLPDITLQLFEDLFHTNVRAPMLLSQAVLPHLRRPGRIINISSIGAREGHPGSGTYAATKGALEAYTRTWAAELGKDETTVNCVNPGPVESEMLDSVSEEVKGPQFLATPVGKRAGKPEEIANVVAFLAEERSSWISGQCISASGGYAQY